MTNDVENTTGHLQQAIHCERMGRFAEAIELGASDFIMPDLMKCGGVTGWLQVAAQAEAANIPMSSHLFAEASAHMLAVTPTAHWLEYLDFASIILAHPVEIVDGTRARYVEAFERLTGIPFAEYRADPTVVLA